MNLKLSLMNFSYTLRYPIYNVCQYLVDEKCPLKAGHNYTMNNHISVPEVARGLRINTEASLEDEEERQHVCLNFDFLLK